MTFKRCYGPHSIDVAVHITIHRTKIFHGGYLNGFLIEVYVEVDLFGWAVELNLPRPLGHEWHSASEKKTE